MHIFAHSELFAVYDEYLVYNTYYYYYYYYYCAMYEINKEGYMDHLGTVDPVEFA